MKCESVDQEVCSLSQILSQMILIRRIRSGRHGRTFSLTTYSYWSCSRLVCRSRSHDDPPLPSRVHLTPSPAHRRYSRSLVHAAASSSCVALPFRVRDHPLAYSAVAPSCHAAYSSSRARRCLVVPRRAAISRTPPSRVHYTPPLSGSRACRWLVNRDTSTAWAHAPTPSLNLLLFSVSSAR